MERDTAAALKLLKRLLHNQPVEPKAIVIVGLRSYESAPSGFVVALIFCAPVELLGQALWIPIA